MNMQIREEQLVYAKWLNVGMVFGFIVLVISFINYVFSFFLDAHIELDKIAQYWSLSADEFRIATNSASGWNWLSLSHKSDYINFFGISILSLITIVCYVRIIPIFIKNSDFLYCTIAILEVIILTLAASGLLNIGH
jgi:hypothetical protein